MLSRFGEKRTPRIFSLIYYLKKEEKLGCENKSELSLTKSSTKPHNAISLKP